MKIHVSLFCAAAAICALPVVVRAQENAPITGQWIIEDIEAPGQVGLTLHRSFGKSGSSTNSSGISVSALKGLTAAQMNAGDGGMVHFEIVRDAGTLACEGYFKRGAGAGTLSFHANPQFASEMRKLGYEVQKPEMFFSMAAHDISLAYIRDLDALHIRPANSDELVTMRIHGVSVEFVRELQALGYSNLKPDQLVTMRIHGVTADFIRELKKLGYNLVPTDELVTMRIHGATTEFIQDLKTLGYEHPSIDQLVTMRIHGVTPEYIRHLQSRGMKNLSIDQMVSLRIHGIAD
ncbi:MAG TPA: hypothetical protein VJN43_07025 [Bryobacteraceae bacterium]|nr:hypothetical protein [Bryobacteraceae bacterium]